MIEEISIKNEDIPRLILDLLIKNSIQTKIIQDLVILTLGAASPDSNRDTIVKAVQNSLATNYNTEKETLLMEIYKEYGHLDLKL